MGIHLHLPRLASCLLWPIAKSGFTFVKAWRAKFPALRPGRTLLHEGQVRASGRSGPAGLIQKRFAAREWRQPEKSGQGLGDVVIAVPDP